MKKKFFSSRKALIISGMLMLSAPAWSQWSLTGNAGTNPATNFLGTTDNKALVFRTNNIPWVSISNYVYGGIDAGSIARPSYINILSRDISDTLLPFSITGNIAGQTWGNSPGKTMGRLLRLNQTHATAGWNIFYDMGIGQDSCFFITNQSEKPAVGYGVIRKRMIVISPEDRVGINLEGDNIGNGAVPTANFHTNGTVRLENLPSGSGSVLVIDEDGNVFRSTSNARLATNETPAEVDELKKEVESLKQQLAELKQLISQTRTGIVQFEDARAGLLQNAPNPFNRSTRISYTLPENYKQAALEITDMNGKLIKKVNLTSMRGAPVTIEGGELPAGTYLYSLIVDGERTATKKMVLTR